MTRESQSRTLPLRNGNLVFTRRLDQLSDTRQWSACPKGPQARRMSAKSRLREPLRGRTTGDYCCNFNVAYQSDPRLLIMEDFTKTRTVEISS
jgi:hypothetical protein